MDTKYKLKTAEDLYEKLKFELRRIEQSECFEYDFWNVVVTAWHLNNEWIKSNAEADPSLRTKVNKVPPQVETFLRLIQDIANGSKHLRLDAKSSSKSVVDVVHSREVNDWYQYFFYPFDGYDVDEYYFSPEDVVDLISLYFEWVFNKKQTHQDDPKKLLDKLEEQKTKKTW
ncbi:MAG: hypothetical protein JXR47_07530 [Thiotrichales bacterium]|nr:hypothetical protein [Thiotrichales bacterium]